MNRPLPTSQAQNEAAAARGKAIVEDPTWSGTTAMARPSVAGSRNRNTRAVLRNVRTWLKVSASRMVLVSRPSIFSMAISSPATRLTSR